ncbi:MAG: ABC transporter substrate-binding protein [Candidatus Syntrophoarchaeum caldarius]|uniref:Chorismate dehydratase n=1 Tax=Candidatus Syntropharchaeum caldarium TaxID=1838285 RepID=A0A1F2PCI6_9EURY|nr:MAG: ABC transporter substrate-binding protein [Candidatus Syntrophoarchaeum caldarius]
MEQTGLIDSIELVKGTPRELIGKLRQKELDISAISSIEYCRGDEELLLIPGVSITAYRSVESVILLSKYPFKELDQRTISLSNASSTSQTLLKILLEYYYGIKPVYFECEPDPMSMLMDSDAALLIGDLALVASWNEDDLFKYDLSKEWHRFTGMGMSYAIWVIREEYAISEPEEAARVSHGIKDAMRAGEANLDRVAAIGSDEKLPQDRLKRYFRQLSFNFDDKDIKGMEFFFKKAFELGFVEHMPTIRFFGD